MTEGDASTPFILRQALGTNAHAHTAPGTTFLKNRNKKSVMMTEESRGKRRKQANPRRNRGKTQRWKVFTEVGEMMQQRADVGGQQLSCEPC